VQIVSTLTPQTTASYSISQLPKDLYTKYYNNTHFSKVLIIGLGQLGLPVAKYVNKKGFDTYGYDLNDQALDRAQKIAGIKRIGDKNSNNINAYDFSEFDVFIVCVSTHKPDDMFSPQIDGLLSIVEKISKEAKNGALVSIESTIPKGTSKKVFEMLSHRLHVAHAPHRWYALEQEEHGVNQLRVLGGVCQCCLDVAMDFYDGRIASDGYNAGGEGTKQQQGPALQQEQQDQEQMLQKKQEQQQNDTTTYPHKSLGIRMHPVPQIEIAEITKIAENAHRYLQIAFAEDLYLYCQANNINFAELRDALNTKWNVNILEPRDGIGGHCLPKDTKMFLQSSKSIKSKILASAIEVDEDYRRYRQTRTLVVKSDSQHSFEESNSDLYKST
jgi:UDP-N-acetyl-D-mannosaminuronate dehydrogenase